MKKDFLILALIFFYNSLKSIDICSLNKNDSNNDIENRKELLKNFNPDVFINSQLPQDLELLKKVKNLFFERDDKSAEIKRKNVYEKAIKEYGAKELFLLTEDGFRISTLYFERKNAPINIVYVTGYFHDLTPLKEWCAPFAEIFPNYNILSFDWRGFGDSEGINGKWTKNSFGSSACPDIQAAIDFFRKENNKPIVLVGFCFGAAMALRTTIIAQEQAKNIADVLVLNSIFTEFKNQFNRAFRAEDRFSRRVIMKSGICDWFLENVLWSGSLFDVKPIEDIKKILIPCYFEHFINDPFAIIEEGIEVFNHTPTKKKFVLSEKGRHVRIHSVVPFQYGESLNLFLKEIGFLN